MDGLRNPVGELPPEVYWRRRIVIGAALVILIAVLWVLITSPRDGDTGATGPATSPDVTTSVDVSSSPGVTFDVARECTDADIAVAAAATSSNFAVGSLPVFNVTVTMNGLSPCKLTVTPENSSLAIRSGSDRIFNSMDCPADATITDREFILQPGMEDQVFPLTWNRKRSAEGCTTVTAEPRAGTYRATVTLQGVAAEEAVFNLG